MREVLYEDQLLHKKINTTNKLAKQNISHTAIKTILQISIQIFRENLLIFAEDHLIF